MYSDEIVNQEPEAEEINIVPISKWKRILVYFADAMIVFILTYLLYNLAVVPLGKLMTSYNQKDALYSENSEVVVDVLYGNEILYKNPSKSVLDYQASLEYTCDCFFSYYSVDEVSIDDKNPQYGHKEENEVLKHYFIDIRNDQNSYVEYFDKYNAKNEYFIKNNGDTYQLKAEIKEQLHAIFDPKDEASKDGLNIYDNLKNNFFSKMYGEVMKSIEKDDLTFNGKSYNEAKQILDSIDTYHGNLLSICSIISYFIMTLGAYLIFPLCNKRHRTLAMMMMRVERLNVNRLFITKKREVIYNAIYGFASGMYITFFLPLAFVTFNYIFSMPTLFVVSIASFIFILASLIVMLFSSFNRTISDIFTSSVLVNNEEIDKIYKAKGYQI